MKHLLRATFHAFALSLTALAAADDGFIGFSVFGRSQAWELEQ